MQKLTPGLRRKYNLPERVVGTCSIQNLKPNHATYLLSDSFLQFLKPNKNVCVLVPKNMLGKAKKISGNTYVAVSDPFNAFVEIHNGFHRDFSPCTTGFGKPKIGSGSTIHPTVQFGDNVILGKNVSISPYVTIGSNVVIGDNTIIFPQVSIYNDVTIGKNCVIDSGAVIGAEGFSVQFDAKKGTVRLLNVGKVKIGNNVDIGVHAVIDRGSMFDTVIEDNVKINNLAHIGHNNHIGKNSKIGVGVIISGSCKIGKNVWITNGSIIRDQVKIEDNAQVLLGSVLINSVKKNQKVSGNFAMDHEMWKRNWEEIQKKKSE